MNGRFSTDIQMPIRSASKRLRRALEQAFLCFALANLGLESAAGGKDGEAKRQADLQDALPNKMSLEEEIRALIPEPAGEPYELLGKRMVFINWFYVRSDNAGWSPHVGQEADLWQAKFGQATVTWGIRLVAQPAQRESHPIIRPEKPWERDLDVWTIMKDKECYHLWGSCKAAGSKGIYYRSVDGRNWERPDLGLLEYEGNRNNNLLPITGAFSVFIDPAAPESERYKIIVPYGPREPEIKAAVEKDPAAWRGRLLDLIGGDMGKGGYVSADGIHWKDHRPLLIDRSDTHVIGYYDTHLKKYVLYSRNFMVGAASAKVPDAEKLLSPGHGRRAISRSESSTFSNFPPTQVIVETSPAMSPNDQLYTNCRTTIPGAPDQHLMFPAIWHVNNDTMSIALFSSHDGRLWHEVPGSPVLDTANFGEWDGGCVSARPNLTELPNGDFVLPYTGYNVPHKYPRKGAFAYENHYMAWPKGRIVALEARERGEFSTVSFVCPGKKLLINAVTKRAGGIFVEVERVEGRSFGACTPIVGDRFRHVVTWKDQDTVGVEPGHAIVLHFRLDQAQLFGLEFE